MARGRRRRYTEGDGGTPHGPIRTSPMSPPRPDDLALAQGLFYVITGLWPVANMASFLRVTGPKSDLWLVKTAGLLIAVIGAALLASRGNDPSPVLGAGAAFVLGAADIVYSAKRVISPVYLLDAAAEALLIAAWVWAGV